jgi:hypothetical protein
MNRDPYKLRARACLEEAGYAVQLIDEVQDEKRADLFATCETDSLIIEVKCKYDDEELYEQLRETEPRKIIPYHAHIQRNNSLASLIEEASRQIEGCRHLSDTAFGVLWFHPDPKLGFSDSDQQVQMNLYGGRYAFVDAPDGSGWTMPCYYTTYADFYRYRSIAAVVLHSKEGVQLLPNPFSTRADDFRGTTLYDDFRRHSAVWAPELLAAEGVALCLTGSVNLKDLRAVVVALEKQNPGYKIVRFVDMHSYGGVMNV